jgi:HEPN domain-containing protein
MYSLADNYLMAAELEFEHNEKDVIPQLVCSNSRQSISFYLTAFLIQNDIAVEQPSTLESLLRQCQTVDPRFKWIDLSGVYCRLDSNEQRFCYGHHKVNSCLKTAQEVRAVIKS